MLLHAAGRLPVSSAHSMNAKKCIHAQKPYFFQAFVHDSSMVGGRGKIKEEKERKRKKRGRGKIEEEQKERKSKKRGRGKREEERKERQRPGG